MEEKLISVIIPVYNVEKYLRECMDSVITQTYKNLEIILVDDGSPDKSGEICDEYSKKDSRVKVLHKENTGLSGARNAGMEQATGKYIMFLDSDDYLEVDSCEKLYREIERTNSDYVVGNYTNTDENGTKWVKPAFSQDKYFAAKLLIDDYENSFYLMNSGVWNKIWRKSFLDKFQIKFVEGALAEDAIFTTYCFMKAKTVYYIPDNVYNYRLRYSDSISSNCSKEYFLRVNKADRIIYNNAKENNRLDYYRYFYAKRMNYVLYKFIDSDKLTKEERIEILDKTKWFYTLSNDLKIPSILKPIKYIIESISNKDYAQVIKYCEILNQVRKMLPKELKEKMSKPNAETYKQIEENDMDIEILEKKEQLLKKMGNSQIKILGIEDTINEIKIGNKSISRFGDGELDIIVGRDLKFQGHNQKLAERLEEILKSNQDFCIIGVPDVLNEFNNLTEESEAFWIRNMERTRDTWIKYLNEDMSYGTANLTRLYIRHKDRSNCGKYFSMLKSIWEGRDVVICEGEQTRFGVGNDLLDKCKTVRRVICPAEDAFSQYDEILSRLKKEDKNTLIIMALGPTATVLAYDLSKEGYQALDIGHFDIEYEWYKRNATKKEKIENKYTNEVVNGNATEDVDDIDYKKQIDTIIS